MQADQVLEYLQQHPEFLQEHASRFGLRPSLERVISLSERQLLESRDKYRYLEKQLKTLIANAETNDETQRKVHQMTLGLLLAQSLNDVSQTIPRILTETFGLDRSALRVWHDSAQGSLCYGLPSAECRRQIQSQSEPLCTQYVNDELLAWLPQLPVLESFAVLPLRNTDGEAIGVLLIGSSDPERFVPQMHNDYLKILAAQISAAMVRMLSQPVVTE